VWTSRAPDLLHPDICVFDLDPSADEPDRLRAAALALRDLLNERNQPSWVKTSGSKGFHILVPLREEADSTRLWRFAHGASALLVKRHPDLLTHEFIKADRAGRVFLDTGRNAPGATFAAVYAVRAKPGAPVSAPCTWQEIERGDVAPQTFKLRAMADRLRDAGELWAGLDGQRVALTAALAALESRLSEADWQDVFAASTRRPKSRKPA
jgi:bifunctional non-homologous end joining protein LigD